MTADVTGPSSPSETSRRERDGRAELADLIDAALGSARMIAWEWDARRQRLACTDGAAEILGLAPGARISAPRDLAALVHADDRARYDAEVREPIRRGEPHAAMYRVVRPIDGGVVWIESTGRGELDAEGRLALARGVLTDVTAREEAERRREEAQLGSQLKDEFLARVSHELRTPLAAMRMWIQVLRTGRPEDRRMALDAIDKSAAAQSKLIEDLLDLARGVNGKLRITEEILDARVPIEEAVSVMRPEAEDKSILLLTAIASDAGYVRGDPGRLQQVVVNLLSNAIKFTPPGGRIEVLLRAVGDDVVLSVSDTGVGLEPAAREAIFAPFRQHGPSTVPSAHAGLGLGLTIARHLVELHHGSVRAESRGPRLGSTFVVTLPRLPDDEVPPSPSQKERAREERALPLAGVRVLLVEDHAPTRDGLARVLATLGAEPMQAASAAEAFALLTRAPPHVIVADIALPGEDGYAFIARVRATGGPAAAAPAVALTAHARLEDAARALASGFQVHLAKPLDSRRIVESIALVLGRNVTGNASSVEKQRPRRTHRRD